MSVPIGSIELNVDSIKAVPVQDRDKYDRVGIKDGKAYLFLDKDNPENSPGVKKASFIEVFEIYARLVLESKAGQAVGSNTLDILKSSLDTVAKKFGQENAIFRRVLQTTNIKDSVEKSVSLADALKKVDIPTARMLLAAGAKVTEKEMEYAKKYAISRLGGGVVNRSEVEKGVIIKVEVKDIPGFVGFLREVQEQAKKQGKDNPVAVVVSCAEQDMESRDFWKAIIQLTNNPNIPCVSLTGIAGEKKLSIPDAEKPKAKPKFYDAFGDLIKEEEDVKYEVDDSMDNPVEEEPNWDEEVMEDEVPDLDLGEEVAVAEKPQVFQLSAAERSNILSKIASNDPVTLKLSGENSDDVEKVLMSFPNAVNVDLTNCSNLTTDIIRSLEKLPNLKEAALPRLSRGKDATIPFPYLYALGGKYPADLSILVGDKAFPAHKNKLGARFSVPDETVKLEEEEAIIKPKDYAEGFSLVHRYIYSGKFREWGDLGVDQAQNIVWMSQIPGFLRDTDKIFLQKECQAAMITYVKSLDSKLPNSMPEALALYLIGTVYGMTNLVNRALEKIADIDLEKKPDEVVQKRWFEQKKVTLPPWKELVALFK